MIYSVKLDWDKRCKQTSVTMFISYGDDGNNSQRQVVNNLIVFLLQLKYENV